MSSTYARRGAADPAHPDGEWLIAPPPRQPLQPRERPTIALVIPAFQVAGTIGAALESAFEQALAFQEVVVCDDGSSDGLLTAVEPFLDRITLLQQPNKGVSAARNRAVSRTTSEFIAWLDGDDRLATSFVAEVSRAIQERPDLDLIGLNGFFLHDHIIGEMFQPSVRQEFLVDQRLAMLRGNGLYLPVVRARAFAAVNGFDESLRCMEDWDCWLRMILDGSVCGHLRAPIYFYRRSAHSLTGDVFALSSATSVISGKALQRTDLSAAERRIARQVLDRATRTADRYAAIDAATAAVIAGDPGARRLAARAAVTRGVRRGTRARFALAALAPRLARTRLHARTRRRGDTSAATQAR